MRTAQEAFTSVHSYFVFDHARLDKLLVGLVKTVESGDLRAAEKAFGHFDRGIRRHFSMEEEIVSQLYAFDRTGIAKGPTSTIQSEHVVLLSHVAAMGKALAAHDAAGFRSAYDSLNAILPEHSAREDQVLYPLVDSLLGTAESQRLVNRLRAG